MNRRLKADDQTQKRLWKSAVSGDRAALEKLLNGHQDMIFRFCCSRLRQESLAVEATQETALRMIKNLGRFKGQGKLTTWILGIANNVCREMVRQEQKWTQVENEIEYQQFESRDDSNGDKELLASKLEDLPPRQKTAITLRYFEALSVAETAEVMQVSEGTVKATIHQAMKNLKLKLKVE